MFCRSGGVFDMIEAKMPWLRGGEFKEIQQDGARPHIEANTVEELQAGGTGDGWVPIIPTQPPNSPDGPWPLFFAQISHQSNLH